MCLELLHQTAPGKHCPHESLLPSDLLLSEAMIRSRAREFAAARDTAAQNRLVSGSDYKVRKSADSTLWVGPRKVNN